MKKKLDVLVGLDNKEGKRAIEYGSKLTTATLIIAFAIISLTFTASCSDDGVIYIDNYIVKDTTQYRLENTSWKLAYFVDIENNTKREPNNPFTNPEIYTIYFDSTMDDQIGLGENSYSMGVIGIVYYDYSANYIDLTIKFKEMFSFGAHPIDPYDDDNFYDAILNTTAFELTKNQLKLFYNNRKNYLLFKPLNVEVEDEKE